jgi:hypothetical protein
MIFVVASRLRLGYSAEAERVRRVGRDLSVVRLDERPAPCKDPGDVRKGTFCRNERVEMTCPPRHW